MTEGIDKPWFGAGKLSERKRSWSVLADCSMPALQLQETRRRQLYSICCKVWSDWAEL